MINKNTVFILGAGASSEFGFPLGERLRQEVINTFIGNSQETESIAKVLTGNWPEDFKEYIKPINEFAYKLKHSVRYSIDDFLERYQKTYLSIGKLAIALVLTRYENHDLLFESDNWYRKIYDRMSEGTNIETFSKNKVSFITFNYDRSLEHFLYITLTHSDEKITEERVKEIINQIPIIHIYGQLDLLPWQDAEGRPYGNPITLKQLKRYKDNINIIFENVTEKVNTNFQKAIDLLKQAEKIYILGFGFHPTNLTRLKLNEIKKRNIVATCHEINEEKIDYIRKCLALPGYPSLTMYSSEGARRDKTKEGTKLYNIKVYDLICKYAIFD